MPDLDERAVARGIQRQKDAEGAAKLAAGLVGVPLFFFLCYLPQWTYIPPGWGYLAVLLGVPAAAGIFVSSWVRERALSQ